MAPRRPASNKTAATTTETSKGATSKTHRTRTSKAAAATFVNDPEKILRNKRAAMRIAKPERPDDLVNRAIASVTEAKRTGYGSRYSLYSLASLNGLREARRSTTTISQSSMARRRNALLSMMPVGRPQHDLHHSVLVVYELLNPDDDRSILKHTIYDSDPGRPGNDEEDGLKAAIESHDRTIISLPWDHKNPHIRGALNTATTLLEEIVPRQFQCGPDPFARQGASVIHVIINGWVRAMDLKFNPDPNFTVDSNFVAEGADKILSALDGKLSSEEIYTWLRSHDYVKEGEHRSFAATKQMRSQKDVNARIAEVNSAVQGGLSQ